MNIIYESQRTDSVFALVDVDGKIYAIDEDTSVGVWGKYLITETEIFCAGFYERIKVTPDGDIRRIDIEELDTDYYDVFFGDFDFTDEAKSPEELF